MKFVIFLVFFALAHAKEQKVHKKRYLQEFGYGFLPPGAQLVSPNNVPINIVQAPVPTDGSRTSIPFSGDHYLPLPPPPQPQKTITIATFPPTIRTYPHHPIVTNPHHQILTNPHHSIITNPHHQILANPHHSILANPHSIIAIIARSAHHTPSIYAPLLSTPVASRLIIIPIIQKPLHAHEEVLNYDLPGIFTNGYGHPGYGPQPFNLPVVAINNQLQELETNGEEEIETASPEPEPVKEPLRIIVEPESNPEQPPQQEQQQQQQQQQQQHQNEDSVTIEARKGAESQQEPNKVFLPPSPTQQVQVVTGIYQDQDQHQNQNHNYNLNQNRNLNLNNINPTPSYNQAQTSPKYSQQNQQDQQQQQQQQQQPNGGPVYTHQNVGSNVIRRQTASFAFTPGHK